MNSPLAWKCWKPALGLIVILVAILAALMIIGRKPKAAMPAQTKILDPRLNVLWAQVLKGSNAYFLPAHGNVLGSQGLGSGIEGNLRQELHQLGLPVDTLPAVTPAKSPNARTFLICYAFPDPPTSSMHLTAELVIPDGTPLPLRNMGGGGGGPPERSWDLWTLDSLPSAVTTYALRLKLQTNSAPLAEIRFPEP